MSLIRIDVGTTHLKAAAFSPEGRLLSFASLLTPTQRLENGGAEYDPEQIWQGVAECLRQVMAHPSLAVRTMAYDLNTRAWATGLLKDQGLTAGFMPLVIPTGARAGEVREAAAALTGLPVGTAVVASGHDHPCAEPWRRDRWPQGPFWTPAERPKR